ncbi:ELKS/Rab6-interacting/CAST family member 1-like isoform X3 [Diadema antillarum]|uniref:ELKS/Rab6-interacting/CAST family member 1-like isoform X3 n=1 Tax=Diadema antillarum TaxID=105358 RepID=UPI003A87B9A3
MYTTRRSPLTDQGDSSSGGSSTSAASSSSSDPRSPSKSSKIRPQRPELSGHLPMETIQSFNAAYNAGPVYISEGLGSPIHGRGSPNSSSSGKSNSPTHSRSSSLGSSHGMTNSSPQAQAAMQAAVMAGQQAHPDDMRHALSNRDLHMDIHTQLREYQRENEGLRQELEGREAKLNSSMNSIKTFWSPELKKERALRKEEASKIQSLKEQCRVAVEENQQFLRTIQQLKEQLQQREPSLRHSPNGDIPNGSSSSAAVAAAATATAAHLQHEVEAVRAERDRSSREVFLLRKTLEEMELRIETQKQTLTARDESIKKLLEMLQSKGLNTKRLEGDQEEMDRMRSQVVEAEARVVKLQKTLELRDREMTRMMDENREDGSRTRSNGMIGQNDDSHSRLKIKLDQYKGELSLKVAELQALQTKLEALRHRERDQQAHIDLLKESLAAKEQHSSILQADVEALRCRLEEKEHLLNRQEVAMTSMSSDQSKQSSEVLELRDVIEQKERRIALLQRKIDSLQEQLKEREGQTTSLRERITSLQADRSSSDSAVSSLEDALIDKERSIEKLRVEREREVAERQEAVGRLTRQTEDLRGQVEQLQKSVSEKEASFMDLKEHASTLASGALKKDSRITTLEIQLAQKTEELNQVETELKKLKEEREAAESKEIKELQGSVSALKEEVRKSQAEVDRLLEIMKEMEGEKNDKEKRIKDLEGIIRKHCPGQLKEVNKKVVAVKRDQQVQKRKNAQLLEEARRREGELSSDTQQLQDMVKEKEDRVEELAEALKESVTITADREMLLAQQTETISKLKKQMDDVRHELEEVKKQLTMASNKLTTTQVLLKERESKLRSVQAEARKHLEEALDMKQEALTAAIGEKDAHIALLELNRKSPKTSDELRLLKKEKDALVQQLKDETQKRMKLLHNHNDGEKSPTLEHSPITPEQDDEDGIWA